MKLKRLFTMTALSIFILVVLIGCYNVPLKPTTPPAQNPPSQMQVPQSQESQTNQPQSSPGTQNKIKIYLIAVEDNGKSGEKLDTGDSVVPVERNIKETTAPLRVALEELLSLKEKDYRQSGLYNPLYRSNLKVEQVRILSGKAEIYLTGTLSLGGEMDNPRVKAQLEKTSSQFSSVKDLQIYLNGKTLDEALSLKG